MTSTQQRKVETKEVKTPLITAISEVKEETITKFLASLYDISRLTQEDFKNLWEAFSYKGFNREETLKQMAAQIKDHNISIEIIAAVAMRGPQAAAKLKFSNGLTASQMGIPASGGKGTKALTLNKIVSATADLAAFILQKMNMPKRLNMDLPGWLQFPSAGSIKLPSDLRIQHLEFSKKFSVVIGGAFQDQIYMQMENNAYLDPNLKLFN